MRKHTYEEIKNYFYQEGCTLLQEEYFGQCTKLKYIPRCGHENYINFKDFKQNKGRFCPICANKEIGKKLKLTYKYVKNYFNKFGYKLLENKYIGVETKMKFECPNGHVHKISFHKFSSGRRCMYCYKTNYISKRKHSYEYIKNFFLNEGCKLLNKEYKNSKEKLLYVAQCGHKHKIAFSIFKMGHGRFCPKCAFPSKENSVLWNPLLTDEERLNSRKTVENKEWRRKVFRRDYYTCQITGEKKNIVAHHLKPYHKYKDLRFDVDNGITLNKEFHKFAHKIFGYKAEIGIEELVEAKYLWENK
jgi:hypothetical protein